MNLSKYGAVIAATAMGWAACHAEIAIGDKAPMFKAKDQNGSEWSLQEHLAKEKHLVIYFYPAAMTGGCTKQACSYSDYLESAPNPRFQVVGISGDTPESLAYFKQAEQIRFTLLSDPDGTIATTFGVPVVHGTKSITRTVAGKEVELTRTATAKRWTFIVDPSGTVIYRKAGVNPLQDLDDVLGFLGSAKKQD